MQSKITQSAAAFCVLLMTVCTVPACVREKENADDSATQDATQEHKIYSEWLIDLENVESGCSRPDCIRSIDAPKFIDIAAVDFLEDSDLVIGMRMGDTIKCYPHAILNYHEIVNDKAAGKNFALNYCPLTGSGMAWDRTINGKITNFGVSGMLYNSNVIPYDRNTRSSWSQMKQVCVNGELMKSKPIIYPVIETSWKTWKEMFPGSKVLSTETGMQRDYSMYPYEDYRTNSDVMFATEYDNYTLPQKERLYGITNGETAVCYRYANFAKGTKILTDTAFNNKYIIVGNEERQFINAFIVDGTTKYHPVNNMGNAVFADATGNAYDIFGYCVAGDKSGSKLIVANGYFAYWFGWYAFSGSEV